MLELDLLLNGDSSSINNLKTELCKRGWEFVHISDDLLKEINLLSNSMDEFFNNNKDLKKQYTQPSSIFGYQYVNHKESLRWLTYERFDKKHFPDSLQEIISNFTLLMDNLMQRLSNQLCINLFGKSCNELGDEYDLALFSEKIKGKRFGMLDVAHYLNLPGVGNNYLYKDYPPKNCVEHYDPGLLSLSFYSSSPGLQLLDLSTDKWIDGPCNTIKDQENIAVIWCGAAAAKIDEQYKPAVHRVEYPKVSDKPQPRMAIWYEICTSSQETDYLKFENTNELPPNILIENEQNHSKPRERTMKQAIKKKNTTPLKAIHPPKQSSGIVDKIYSVFSSSYYNSNPPNRIEQKTGVPMSKSKRPSKINSQGDTVNSVTVSSTKSISDNETPKKTKPHLTTKKNQRKNKMIPIKSTEPSYEEEFGIPMSKIAPDINFNELVKLNKPEDNISAKKPVKPITKEDTKPKKTKQRKNKMIPIKSTRPSYEATLGVPMSKVAIHIPITKDDNMVIEPKKNIKSKQKKSKNTLNSISLTPSYEATLGVPMSKVAIPYTPKFEDIQDDPMEIDS